MSSRKNDVKYPTANNNLPEVTSYPLFPPSQVPTNKRGEDNKINFIPYCSLQCHAWKESYRRCEKARTSNNTNKPSTCLHVWRETYECIEGCVQPKVVNNLAGANEVYHVWY